MSRRGENIYKRKDGRWEGRYIKARTIDGSVQYGYLYAKKYGELREQLIMMRALHQRNYTHPVTNYKGTLAQWVPLWFADITPKIKPSTYASYSTKMKKHILPYFGSQVLSEIRAEIIQDWVNQLGPQLSASSIRSVYQVFTTCCSAAVKHGILQRNPCFQVNLPKGNIRSVKSLSLQEQQRIKKGAENDLNGLPILVALDTGLRIGELSGLKWEDIDLSNRILHVRRTVQRVPKVNEGGSVKTILITGTPKSESSIRMVPLSTNIFTLLKQKKKDSKGPFIFGGEYPAEPRKITYWFKKICQDAKIDPISFHALRHSFATRCIEKGVTVTTISALLGHTSIKMTLDTYTNSFLSEKRKAIQMIS